MIIGIILGFFICFGIIYLLIGYFQRPYFELTNDNAIISDDIITFETDYCENYWNDIYDTFNKKFIVHVKVNNQSYKTKITSMEKIEDNKMRFIFTIIKKDDVQD